MHWTVRVCLVKLSCTLLFAAVSDLIVCRRDTAVYCEACCVLVVPKLGTQSGKSGKVSQCGEIAIPEHPLVSRET